MTQLLVSVRSPAEALAALAGGADLIDAKEPATGSLGAVAWPTLTAIIDAVAGRAPVSAALGEWSERATIPKPLPVGLTYAKLGLAGVADIAELATLRTHIVGATPVLVAYADHVNASSPNPRTLAKLALEERYEVFLLDTFRKDGSTLLDWLPVAELRPLVATLQATGVKCALAGSLRAEHVAELRGLAPTWFAVRGAACEGGRTGVVSTDRVRMLRAMLEA